MREGWRWARRSDPQVPGYREWPFAELGDGWRARPFEYRWALDRVKTGDRVIDVGCGWWHPLTYMAAEKTRTKVIGVDPKAPRELKVPEAPVEFVRSTIEAYRAKEQADVVTLISVLEHVVGDGKAGTLLAVARCMKPNGRLILTVDVRQDGWMPVNEFLVEAGLEPLESPGVLPDDFVVLNHKKRSSVIMGVTHLKGWRR